MWARARVHLFVHTHSGQVFATCTAPSTVTVQASASSGHVKQDKTILYKMLMTSNQTTALRGIGLRVVRALIPRPCQHNR